MTSLKNLLKDKKIPKPRQESFEGLPIRELGKQTRLWIDNEFFEHGFAETFRGKRVLDVYCVLAKYANAKTQSCFPAVSKIMKEAGIKNRNTVIGAIKLLEAFGLIYIVHSKGWRPNHYVLLRDSTWKPANSITIDTVLSNKRKGKSVSNNSGEQYQKQSENSITSDTRSHISKSDNEIKDEFKKFSIKGTDLLQRLSPASKSVLKPCFSEDDIIAALEELAAGGSEVEKLGYKPIIEALHRRGAIPTKELPPWIKA